MPLKLLEFLRCARIARVPAAHRHGRSERHLGVKGPVFHGRLCLRRRFRAQPCRCPGAVPQDRSRSQGHSRSFRRGLGEHCPADRNWRQSTARLYRQIYIDGIRGGRSKRKPPTRGFSTRSSSRPAARTSPARQRNLMSKLTIKAVRFGAPGKLKPSCSGCCR